MHSESTDTTSPPQLGSAQVLPPDRQAGLAPLLQQLLRPSNVPRSSATVPRCIVARTGSHKHRIRALDLQNPLLPYLTIEIGSWYEIVFKRKMGFHLLLWSGLGYYLLHQEGEEVRVVWFWLRSHFQRESPLLEGTQVLLDQNLE